jgi:two-component system NtrC family response regulator
LVVTTSEDWIGPDHLPADLLPVNESETGVVRPLADVTEEAERKAIQAALAASDFHRENTARSLAISVRTLHYKMNRFGLH